MTKNPAHAGLGKEKGDVSLANRGAGDSTDLDVA